MTHAERYTLLMTAARDHYRGGEWLVCRDYLRDALTLACTRELERGATWSDRRRWSNGCILALDRLRAACGMNARELTEEQALQMEAGEELDAICAEWMGGITRKEVENA